MLNAHQLRKWVNDQLTWTFGSAATIWILDKQSAGYRLENRQELHSELHASFCRESQSQWILRSYLTRGDPIRFFYVPSPAWRVVCLFKMLIYSSQDLTMNWPWKFHNEQLHCELSHSYPVVEKIKRPETWAREEKNVSLSAFHLSGKTGRNFLANGTVQFSNKQNGTGRVCIIRTLSSGTFQQKKRNTSEAIPFSQKKSNRKWPFPLIFYPNKWFFRMEGKRSLIIYSFLLHFKSIIWKRQLGGLKNFIDA